MVDIKDVIKTLKDMLIDFNKHTALSIDLTDREVEAIGLAIKYLKD